MFWIVILTASVKAISLAYRRITHPMPSCFTPAGTGGAHFGVCKAELLVCHDDECRDPGYLDHSRGASNPPESVLPKASSSSSFFVKRSNPEVSIGVYADAQSLGVPAGEGGGAFRDSVLLVVIRKRPGKERRNLQARLRHPLSTPRGELEGPARVALCERCYGR
jgi:hypothetical protein